MLLLPGDTRVGTRSSALVMAPQLGGGVVGVEGGTADAEINVSFHREARVLIKGSRLKT